MKFLSDILAKAGLTVDGVVTLNNTATGQTPAANDDSTKLATTAWVRGFVTPYSLPIASGTTLGGIKIGSGLAIDGTGIVSVAASGVGAIRALQQITATAGQTVFTVSGGYTPGLIDVFLNGVLLTPTAIVATNGNSFTLADAAVSGDLLDVFVYNPIYNGFISSTDQVPEGIVNFYYTNARARAAISLTVTGASGASTYDSGTGVLNVPTYTLSGLGGVPTSRTITIDGVTYDLTANRTWNILPVGGAVGDILAKNSATNYDVAWIANYTSQVQHYVKLGAAMTAGTAVYVSGSTGNAGTNMIVSKASNATEATSSKTIGLLASGGIQNDIVFVVTEGLVSGIDTSTAVAGDPVWLGTNGQLIFGLVNKPYAPAHLVFIGVVTRVQQNNGEIFVKVQNGFEFEELHNLSVKNASDGDMIKYVASTGLWTKIAATTTNITEGTNLYYTDARVNTYLTANGYATQTYVNTAVSNLVASAPSTLDTLNELAIALGNDPNFATTIATSIGTKVPQTRTLTINGTAYDLSADRSWSIASGVTSFNTRTGAITSASGDYTTAQVTESGNLYYTNARVRLAISLTTTGTSGAASYDNITGILNIPQYQGGVTSFNTRTGAITLSSTDVTTALTYTPVTNARTLTINGDAYDLTADRTWTIGVTPSARTIQTYTATASQTTFTVTGGYVVGLVDVFINGVRLTSADFTASNGTTVVLTTGTGVNNIVDIIKYTSAFTASSALRQVTYFTATAGQTTFTVSYTPGLIDIFYNGSKLASSEYTASNGTSIVLANAAALNDSLEIISYAYSVGAFSGQAQLNGTGLVRMSGTTVSYDNATYATESYVTTAVANLVDSAPTTLDTLNELAAALGDDPNFATTVATSIGTKLPLAGGTLTGALVGTTATFSSFITAQSTGGSGLRIYGSSGTNQWDVYLNSTNLRFSDNTGTGSVVFDRPISGTTAVFTSSVTAQTNLGVVNANASQAGFVADYTGTGALKVSFSTYNDIMNIYNETNSYSLLNFTRSTKHLVLNPTGENITVNTTNTGASGLSINNQHNLSFSEGSGESYVNVFRQRNSAALVMGAGYKRSVTGSFASSFSSAMARAAIAVGYNNGSIVFFTDASSTVANGTDITPTERLVILSSGDIQTKGGTLYIGASSTGDVFVSPSNGYMYFEYPTAYGAIFRTQSGTEAVRYLSSGQANFANIVRTDNPIQVGAGSNNYYTQVTTAYNYPYVDSYFDSVAGASYEGRLNFRTNTGGGSMTTQLSITNVGVATFSNSIISSDGYQGRYYRLREASANRGGLYPFNLVFGSGTDYSIGIFSEGEIFLAPGGSATKRFTMSNSGAASFTGALTVGGTIVINNGGGVSATGSFSTNAGGLQIANGNQTANTTCAQIEFGNRGYFSTANVGAAKIEARSVGGNWYSGTALAFYTNPGPDVTATSPIERLYISPGGQLISYNGQTGGYVRRDSGYVNETATITENRTAYFLYKYSGDANGSSSTTFNITGLSTTNGTWADINIRVRKDATGSAINTVGYIQINGQDMIGGVFASGTAAVQTNRTIRVVRMSDEWIIIGAVGSY